MFSLYRTDFKTYHMLQLLLYNLYSLHKKYILSRNSEAHCMSPNCNIKWTLKFLLESFDKSWVTSSDKQSYQRSKLPETLAQIPL